MRKLPLSHETDNTDQTLEGHLQKIPVHITNRQLRPVKKPPHSHVYSHLIYIKPFRTNNRSVHTKLLDFCLWNARSIKNKSLALKDYIVDHDLDFLALA